MSTGTGHRPILVASDASPMDTTKHDMALTYGGRTFAIRAFRNGSGPGDPGWHAIIIENRTPLRHEQGPNLSVAGCFAEAVRFLTAAVDLRTEVTPIRASAAH